MRWNWKICAAAAIVLGVMSVLPRIGLAERLPATQPVSSYDPTDAYEAKTIEGWTVRVNRRLTGAEPELATETLELLHFQLYQITREVPRPALNKIQRVPIWVELLDPLFPCMCYHPDRGWLVKHGLNPDKAHGVELANARTFLEWEHTQPWMVFHELAHAYHDQFLPGGFENAQVLQAFKQAKEEKRYAAVLRNNGRTERAYAITNQMEYFAECSEAFFGTNDFFPFVRVEFKAYDPAGFKTLKQAWAIDQPASTAAPPGE